MGPFQLLEESPEEQRRRRSSLILACVAEALAAGLLTLICASLPKGVAGHVNRYTVITFPSLAEQQPALKPPALPRRLLAPYVLPKPRIELPKINEPQIKADTRMPAVDEPPLTTTPAMVPARQLPPPPPAVHTGMFGQAPETAVAENAPPRQVQTGGFGSPQGLAGRAQGGNTGNVAKLGSFEMPAGPGAGNGSGGAAGRPLVVADAGFGVRREVTSVNEIDESDRSHRVATSGFGNGGLDAEGSGASSRGAPAAVRTGAFATPEPAQKPANQPATAPPEIHPVEILSKPSPQYTEEARRLGVQGEVILSVIFQADGKLQVVGIIKSLGHGLDQMAEQAATQIRFKPAEQAGKPTSSPAILHIQFRLA